MQIARPVLLRIFKYVLLVGIPVIGLSLIFIFINSRAYQIAASFIRQSEEIKVAAGVPFQGFAILTGLEKNPDDSLDVKISFKVMGPKGGLGAEVSLRSHGNGWAIVSAEAVDQAGTLHKLLNDGLLVDSTDWTALHFAAAQGKTEQVKSLLDKGAVIEARSEKGNTPLYEAAKRGKLEAVKVLLEHGANVNSKNGEIGFTPLHVAAEFKHPAVAKLLLERGAKVNAANAWAQTPLDQAAWQTWHKDSAVAGILLDHGANIEARDNSGWTPLLKAAQAGHAPLVALLISRGADLTAKCDGDRHALFHAAFKGDLPIVKLLLDGGADVNAKAIGGTWTALRLAEQKGYTQIADLLRQRGAKS